MVPCFAMKAGMETEERRLWPWLALALIAVAVILVRWRLLGVALERDEGEYAYGGRLLLQGIPPYTLLYNMKLPGIYAVYALVLALFGATATGVHTGLLVANLLAVLLVFLLGRRLLDQSGAVIAAALFALLSVGEPVQGLFANAEQFVLVPALGGLLILARPRPGGGRFFLAALLLGTALTIKQHALFFLAFGGVLAVREAWRCWRQGEGVRALAPPACYLGGALIPYALVCLWMAGAGVFDTFWFWTITYARRYAAPAAMGVGAMAANFGLRAREIFAAAPLAWLAVAGGLAALAVAPMEREHRLRLAGFFVFSLLAICPGGYFRPHYFVLLLPAAALAAAAFFRWLRRLLPVSGRPATVLFVLTLLSSLIIQRVYLFTLSPAAVVRRTYWPNPFNEAVAVGAYLRGLARPGDRLAVIGSEPEIYFYSGLRSATGYIYMYPLMEAHPFALTMQKELMREVERAAPEFLIFVRNPYSWLQQPDSHLDIYDWFTRYKAAYERLAMVEIFENRSTYSWQEPVSWPPRTPYWMEILRRRPAFSAGP